METSKEGFVDLSSIEKELATYNEPTVEQVEHSEPIHNEPVDWRGNPSYYQTGKKQGQLRPSGKVVSMSSSGYGEQGSPQSEAQGEVNIDGDTFLLIIDLLLPALVSLGNNYFSEDKVSFEQIQMSESQRSKLTPLADKVVGMILKDTNPLALFGVALLSIYSANFLQTKYASK